MYTSAEYHKSSFNCPICGAYAKQIWTEVQIYNTSEPYRAGLGDTEIAVCTHCSGRSIWLNKLMIYPHSATAPLPNQDLPADVQSDYEEARSILNLSPRGAVALLRLAIQKLCKHLGEKGENINNDI